ncbi:hypothetical protein NON20_24235 (plasmid) [Synechocystis sp. B12]|nr:hypothetical protein NON20_24235 [Synechocystis sp. B12]
MLPDRKGWQPRAIRFEIIWLNSVTPFPLNAQQDWQLFDNPENRKLGVQWQLNPKKAIRQPSDSLTLQVDISKIISEQQKNGYKIALRKC